MLSPTLSFPNPTLLNAPALTGSRRDRNAALGDDPLFLAQALHSVRDQWQEILVGAANNVEQDLRSLALASLPRAGLRGHHPDLQSPALL